MYQSSTDLEDWIGADFKVRVSLMGKLGKFCG